MFTSSSKPKVLAHKIVDLALEKFKLKLIGVSCLEYPPKNGLSELLNPKVVSSVHYEDVLSIEDVTLMNVRDSELCRFCGSSWRTLAGCVCELAARGVSLYPSIRP